MNFLNSSAEKPRGAQKTVIARYSSSETSPGLERADHLLVAILEVVGVETEFRDRLGALLAVPRVGAQHAADVEQNQIDRVAHAMSTARAGAPSRPASLSGSTRRSYLPGGGTDKSSPSTMMTPWPSSVRCVR